MDTATKILPSDLTLLKELICKKEALICERDLHIAVLEERINLLLHKRFGPSSEKISKDQLQFLFNEAELESPIGDEETPDETAAADGEAALEDIIVPAHKRKKAGRKPLPENLPRQRIEHDLPEAEKTCKCGCRRPKMGEVITEQLDIIPAKIQVIQHVQMKYGGCQNPACDHYQDGVKKAEKPPQPIPKSNASPGLLAHLAVGKYCDALPLYRQTGILRRHGVRISRTTLANWMIRAGQLVQPLLNLLAESLREHDIVGMDETVLQVLKEDGRAASTNSYMWVMRGGTLQNPIVLYHYEPSRSAQVIDDLLMDYKGFLQTDGYVSYESFATKNPAVTLLGCMAHARRKFDEAVKAQGKVLASRAKRSRKNKVSLAIEGLTFMRRLYKIEREAKELKLEPEKRYELRLRKAKPILDEMRAWLDKVKGNASPKSTTGKALSYLDGQWPKLIRYLEDGRLEIDNNATERAIRPFVIGRKNWLFAHSPRGAQASANLYSLIETAKANDLEPYAWLCHIFTELPKAKTLQEFEALLPINISHQTIKAAVTT